MTSPIFYYIFIFLAAACIVVPLTNRFKLGSVLGYLAAGVLIGPFGIGLIPNSEAVMHFAEFGVVMMLFLIGLELEPQMLWRLRKTIVGLGGLQVILTTALFTVVGVILGFDWRISFICSMALSLSSTAIVLQILQERNALQTPLGQAAFSILLFQDIAVIPILILIPLVMGVKATQDTSLLASLPVYTRAIIIVSVIAIVIISGRYLSRYLFRFVAKTNLREIFTATSLAVVIGITLLMGMIGVSPALGAFVSGVVLANSEYKHSLESDIQPFKGLLLGLFFISVGMGMNFSLVAKEPFIILACVLALIFIKIIILYILGQYFNLKKPHSYAFAFALSQGGEFAFVLFQYTATLHIINEQQTGILSCIVALSMATTPVLIMIYSRIIQPCYIKMRPEPTFDVIEDNHSSVIIAGYGRYGQIIGRFLTLQGFKVTILEKDPDQIEFLRRFGSKVYFGDASRIDLLRNAGADHAKLLIVAIDDAEKAVELTKLAKYHFPKLKVYARARNRRHAYELYKAGADYFRREMFDSSIIMAQEAMAMLGSASLEVTHHRAKQFTKHDEASLMESFNYFESEADLIGFVKKTQIELERILHDDVKETQS